MFGPYIIGRDGTPSDSEGIRVDEMGGPLQQSAKEWADSLEVNLSQSAPIVASRLPGDKKEGTPS
jgi:hypothetical protein